MSLTNTRRKIHRDKIWWSLWGWGGVGWGGGALHRVSTN